MAYQLNKIYALRSISSEKGLNIFAGDISVNSNVVQWDFDPTDKDQQWKVVSSGSGVFLETVYNSGYVLDAYNPTTSGGNADVWQKTAQDKPAQEITLELVSGNTYRVKLPAYNLYLTAYGTAKGTALSSGTSNGNVYWSPNNASSNQQWEFVDIAGTTYPTTSSHDLTVGKTYQLNSISAPSMNANLFAGDTNNATSNVVLYTANPYDSQQNWKLANAGTSGTHYLEYAPNTAFVLDTYQPTNAGANVDVWGKSDVEKTAQELVIRKVSTGRYTVSLRHFPNLYMTAYGNVDGSALSSGRNAGNVYFSEHTGETNQMWNFTDPQERPTTSSHDLTVGLTYQLTNIGTTKNANLFAGDTNHATSNVVNWKKNENDREQKWKLTNASTSGTYYLEYAPNTAFVLDAYQPTTAGANADVWTKSTIERTAQELVIRKVSTGKYTVSLRHFPNLYLTSYGTVNGTAQSSGRNAGNIYWSAYTGADNQLWHIYDVDPDVSGGGNGGNTPDPSGARWGIDVSHHQGTINWTSVKNAGVKFAMIRVGYLGYDGDLTLDTRFKDNISGAINAGIPVGVYAFSYINKEGKAEAAARSVINAIKDYQITYPVVFDIEENNAVDYRNLGKTFNTNLTKQFCQTVKEAGYHAMWYTSRDFAQNLVYADQLAAYDFWLAHVGVAQTNYQGSFTMWQYSWTGRVSGISSDVDMNYCYKDYANGGTVEPPVDDGLPYFFRGEYAKYFKGYFHYYRNSDGYMNHQGIDVCCPEWTPIYSVCPGKVVITSHEHYAGKTEAEMVTGRRDNPNSMGYFVAIQADNPVNCTVYTVADDCIAGGTVKPGQPKNGDFILTFRYLHMVKHPEVSAGAHVDANTLLGYVGNSGASDIPHIHFDANNVPTWNRPDMSVKNTVNPQEFFKNITFQYGKN